MRIVSLLPGATEIICALGLGDQIVGVSHECDYPPFVCDLPKVTRAKIPSETSSREIDEKVRSQLKTGNALYTLDTQLLEALKPDLIVTQALCDVCAVSEAEVQDAVCKLPGRPRVVNLEPQTLSGVLKAIRQVASAVGADEQANKVVARLRSRISAVSRRTASIKYRPRVALLEWLDPPFSCGHWNPALVDLAGGIELLGKEGYPSRTLDWDEVIESQPEVVFIACCGFSVERTLRDLPALDAVPGWQNLTAVRSGRVYVTDGSQYFSRPGPRLVDSLEILAHTLHPHIHPLPEGLASAVPIYDSSIRLSPGPS